jgi:hypothetical protein
MSKGALMNTKGAVMNKPTRPVKKPSKPVTGDKQRGIGVVELLFAAATIGATVVVGALTSIKKPAGFGD